MQMAFTARVLAVLINTIVWLSLMSNFLLPCNGDDESDVNCLKSIKDSMEDPSNYLSSWNFSTNTAGFICKFTGIDCWNPDKNKVLNIRLSDMGLRRQFPRGFTNCSTLTGLDLSSNELFGPIPTDIHQIIHYVTSLDLSSNSFSGEIPLAVANLSYLNILKLDNNRLTGQIPSALGQNRRIKTFSVSNNQLSGPVPSFWRSTISAESYANNQGLCGDPLPPCKAAAKKKFNALFVSGFTVGWSVSTALVFALSLFYLPTIPLKKIMSRRKKKRNLEVVVQASQSPITKSRSDDSKISTLEKLVTRISFTELMNATDNFREDNIIGLGKTGTMYKAVLRNGFFLAIKRFYDSQCYEKHFVSEIMTPGRLRNTNLVPLLGFCYETKERLLVYKYMSNGNLYDWLHPPKGVSKILEWPLRVKIAVGLARGLAWLHHNYTFQVFHHNVSSKGVLLDQNFEPKISNFGEAKFTNTNETILSGSSSMNGELLDMGFDKKDVYSFGVVLLELVTGKEPNKAADSSLVEWFIDLSSTSFSLCDAVDNSLVGVGFDDEIFQFLSVASNCVQSSPEQRPTMLEVYQTMGAVGDKHGLVDDSETWKLTEITTAESEGAE